LIGALHHGTREIISGHGKALWEKQIAGLERG
jgi:hypothetical protein